MKIIFMGTPDFAIPSLKKISINSNHQIVAVYTQPPKKAGRGQKLSLSPVNIAAKIQNIEVVTPVNFKEKKDLEKFKSFKSDIAVVVAYGIILPKEILKIPKYGCINIHPSLLPRWRGAAPIQRAIMEGDEETGISIIQMNENLDSGNILEMAPLPIMQNAIFKDMHDILSIMGAEMVLNVINKIASGNIKSQKQSNSGITYAKKITREDCLINWHDDAKKIYNKIRALGLWPGTFFKYKNEDIKIIDAELVNENEDLAFNDSCCGEVLDNNLAILCKKGVIRPKILKRAGKKNLELADFLRGFPIKRGEILK